MFTCSKCKKTFENRADVTIGGRNTPTSYSYYCRPCRRIIWRRYITSPKGRAYQKRMNDKFRLAKSQKYKANMALGHAVYKGRVNRPDVCEIGVDCFGKIEGHHADYSRKLDVRWLCKNHHNQIHHPQLVT